MQYNNSGILVVVFIILVHLLAGMIWLSETDVMIPVATSKMVRIGEGKEERLNAQVMSHDHLHPIRLESHTA